MSEDEAINKATKFVQEYREKEQKFYDYLFSMKENDIPIQAIDTILDLYNKEKEKNEKLVDTLQKDTIWKDKIRDMKRYREFELQQEYKEFKDDIEWKTYNKILEEK